VVDGAVVARPVVELSLAFDHRVCDGGDAGGLLRLLGDYIEHPELVSTEGSAGQGRTKGRRMTSSSTKIV
jgi:hypothetical protein